ncbi:tail fiber domain-containing protein [Dyadobacter chenhuakuii]|uniref:Tail fiber domain-containing protein n=1 Tax=Dyadobacter chenhuakuii TaxID=2909339 RepID=A0ABY4XS81_9BACT|nr:tail fiber domain-containing protein [Dyadobacter chenhuakuii]MCF2492743.1 tail fiber domain-containing protein [Dyadobacter chenhuakuii]USJ32966.1 tail fiber domain-containing protein [Dyadobacter chenhuakuii]
MRNRTLHLHMRAVKVFPNYLRPIAVALLLLCSLLCNAQAPQQFSFQGVARDAAGKIVANQLVRLRLTIYETAPNSNVYFEEEHTPVTGSNGIFNVSVGSAGMNLTTINWGKAEYYLKVEIDPTSGSNFVDIGTTQLLSVPYALHATEADRLKNDDPVFMTGTVGQGSVLPVIPGNSKFIWYPRKAAFRVGFENTGVWDDSKIGEFSFAGGSNSLAEGKFSSALGNLSIASGEASLAAGSKSEASGFASTALGEGTVAKAKNGVALGSWNTVNDNPNPTSESQTDRIFQLGIGISNSTRINALTILRNSKVGIGTSVTNPNYQLDLGGRMRIRYNFESAGIYFDSQNGNPDGFVGMVNDQQIGFFLKGWRFWVNDQGNGYLNGNLIQTSDRRLKTKIQPFKSSLGKVNSLQGYHYNWEDKTKDQTLQTGLIAQEVEQVFPELVSTNKDGFKSVNYIGLVPHLIESVKELKSKTDEIAVLRKELEGMREMGKRLELLEASINSGANSRTTKSAAK